MFNLVSMGMNSQPPIPLYPAYPRLLLSPWILQLAYYYIYPLATMQRPPPPPPHTHTHTTGKFNPAYAKHGGPYPHHSSHPIVCHASPPLSLDGRVLVLTSCCAQSPKKSLKNTPFCCFECTYIHTQT